MSDQGLTVTMEHGVTVVTFASKAVLDIATTEVMARELLELAKSPQPPRILVDLSAVRFLASRMLGILVELSRKAAFAGGNVVICGLHGDLHEVFKVTRLNRLLNLAPDHRQAMTLLGAAEAS